MIRCPKTTPRVTHRMLHWHHMIVVTPFWGHKVQGRNRRKRFTPLGKRYCNTFTSEKITGYDGMIGNNKSFCPIEMSGLNAAIAATDKPAVSRTAAKICKVLTAARCASQRFQVTVYNCCQLSSSVSSSHHPECHIYNTSLARRKRCAAMLHSSGPR